jgi:photosystem II stability/assembly factor-like uncharacterized protein
MQQFLRECAATKHLTVAPIVDPGYRLRRLNAQYTCLGVHLTIYFRDGTFQSPGGWYLLEKTPYVFWHILLSRSRITPRRKAIAPPQAACLSAIPSYARPSSAQLILGSAFLSATTGWIAVGRSGAYVVNGSCGHGVGTNCNTAETVIYHTDDAGSHWHTLLSLTTAAGPLVWIRLFDKRHRLVAVGMGANDRGVLYGTSDGGRTWRHSLLPAGYIPDPATITFPNPRRGWLYIGGGAMGSMAVTIFGTADGGERWTEVTCTAGPVAPEPCRFYSGIPFGGDKEYITFANDESGWLTIVSNTGTPSLLHSSDGGRTWSDQRLGLPPSVQPPTTTRQIFPMGSFDRPHIFGPVGILAESVTFSGPQPQTSRSRLYLYRSSDAGASWHFYQRTPLPAPAGAQYSYGQFSLTQFVDARRWVAVSGNAIWWTANAGQTWSPTAMRLPPGLRLLALAFTDPSHGWAEAVPRSQIGGMPGGTVLLRTSDGGRDWRRTAVP